MSNKLLNAEINNILHRSEMKAMELLEKVYVGKKIKVVDIDGRKNVTGICKGILDVRKGTFKDGFKVTVLLDVNSKITLDVTCYSSLIEKVED